MITKQPDQAKPSIHEFPVETMSAFRSYGPLVNLLQGPIQTKRWIQPGSFEEVTGGDPDTTGWGTAEDGRFWFNKTTDLVKYWDGSAIQVYVSLTYLVANFYNKTEIDIAIWVRGQVPDSTIDFLDTFDDDSLFWAWNTHGTGVNRTVTESGNVLTIAVAQGADGRWDALFNKTPKVIVGPPGFPCTVTTKLNSFTVNDLVYAGMFIAHNPETVGTNAITFSRRRKNASGWNGLCVRHIGSAPVYTDAITTLPIWLRASMTGQGANGHKIIFSYSTDGTSYITVYTKTDFPAAALMVGLFAANEDAAYNAISVPFEFFRMTRSLGPG